MASATTPGSAAVARAVAQARVSSGVTLAAIIDQTLRDPNIFTFGELLDLPSVQALSTTEQASRIAMLELFAYGTLADYKAAVAAGKSLRLDEPMMRKLRMLTLATIATTRKVVTYTDLLTELDLTSEEELEACVRDAVYAELLVGTLDQRSRVLEVSSALGRDVRPDAVDDLLDRVQAWQAAVDSALTDVAEQIQRQTRLRADAAASAQVFAGEFEAQRKATAATMKPGASGDHYGMTGAALLTGIMGMMGSRDDDRRARGPAGSRRRM